MNWCIWAMYTWSFCFIKMWFVFGHSTDLFIESFHPLCLTVEMVFCSLHSGFLCLRKQHVELMAMTMSWSSLWMSAERLKKSPQHHVVQLKGVGHHPNCFTIISNLLLCLSLTFLMTFLTPLTKILYETPDQ